MRSKLMIGAAALSLAGCALDTGGSADEDEETAEVQEAASTFTAPWSTTHVMRTRPIAAPLGGTITVSAKADFSDHAGCPLAYTAELIHLLGGGREEVSSIARAYPRNQLHSEIWTALAKGAYRVQFSTTRPPKACSLLGTVTVSVKP